MLFLAPEEIQHLTGKKRPSAQRRVLAHMGIRFRVNSLGRPVVCRSAVEADAEQTGERKTKPDLEALRELTGGQKKKNR